MAECALARGYANRLLDVLPADAADAAVVVVAAADVDACTSVYTWRNAASAAAAGADTPARAIAPRMVTRRDDVTSFRARQIVPHDAGHVLVVASDENDTDSGVVAEWDCERERTRGDFTLTFESTGSAVHVTSLALERATVAGSVVNVVGVSDSLLFRATLDRRTPGRTLLAGTKPGSAAPLAPNTWRYAPNAEYTCVATTRDGRAVLGSADGRITLVREFGARATLAFEAVAAPVRALHVTEDGAWVVATYDHCALIVGPFERDWQHERHADVAHAVCTLSADKRRAHGVAAAATYRNARIVGYSATERCREEEACVVVALDCLLLSFPLRRRSKRATRTSARAASAADAECIYALLKALARARADAPDAPLRCDFEHCSVYEAAASIIDHAPHGDAETLALEARLVDLHL